jgi:PKD repeat protein
MTRIDTKAGLLRGAAARLPMCMLLWCTQVWGGQATVAWDPVSGAAGFVLNCGTASANYTTRIDVGANPSFTIDGLNEGTTYYCVVAAYDAARVEGNRSNELTVPVAYSAPVVSFTGNPLSGPVPTTVTFTNSTKGQVTTWLWDFGDGTTGSSQTPTHVYTAPGTFSVTLTAKGPGGTASASTFVVKVSAPNTPPVSTAPAPSGSTAGGSTASGSTTGGSTTTPVPAATPVVSTPSPTPMPAPVSGGTTPTASTPSATTSPQSAPYPGSTGSVAPAARNGLVAAFGFDEGTGQAAADVSGHGNAGVITGASWSAGRYGKALNFSGNGWVTINDSASLHLTSGMTLEAWVNPSQMTTGWTDIIMKQRSWSANPAEGVSYYLTATSEWGYPVGGVTIRAERMVRGRANLPVGTWSYVATTYNGSSQRLYVNGILIASRPQTGRIASGWGPLRIGGDSLWGEHFHGLIDEIRVYNRALTIDEIKLDMNAPLGR